MSLSSWMTHLPRTSLENMPRQTWTETHGNKVTGAPEDDVLPVNSQQGKNKTGHTFKDGFLSGQWWEACGGSSEFPILLPLSQHPEENTISDFLWWPWGWTKGQEPSGYNKACWGFLSVTNEYSHWSWHKLHFPPSYGKMNGLGERCCGERWGSLGLMAESTQH